MDLCARLDFLLSCGNKLCIFRGDCGPSDLPVSLSVHCLDHDAFLFALCQDHKLRMWSYKVSKAWIQGSSIFRRGSGDSPRRKERRLGGWWRFDLPLDCRLATSACWDSGQFVRTVVACLWLRGFSLKQSLVRRVRGSIRLFANVLEHSGRGTEALQG